MKQGDVDRKEAFIMKARGRHGENNLYTRLGFILTETLKPDYRYIENSSPTRRIHKFNLRKKEIFRKYNLSMELTESQLTKILGLSKIWDCGLYRYEWKKRLLISNLFSF